MELRSSDFVVGLFVLGAIGVIVGAVILTSGLGTPRYDLLMRAATANDLSVDTRVVLQGLQVGRVRAILPVIDSANGAVSVVARLSVDRRFRDGTPLRLPVGTRGVIVQRSPIASPVIDLILPATTPPTYLEPGDTIPSQRPPTVLDALNEMALELRGEITATLEETRTLLTRTTVAVGETQGVIHATGEQLEVALDGLARNLDRTEQLLADLSPRVHSVTDSLAVALGDARLVLQSLDSLASLGQALAMENRDAIRNALDHVHRSATILEHFTDKVSRRPLRLFTGVTPPPDSADPHP